MYFDFSKNLSNIRDLTYEYRTLTPTGLSLFEQFANALQFGRIHFRYRLTLPLINFTFHYYGIKINKPYFDNESFEILEWPKAQTRSSKVTHGITGTGIKPEDGREWWEEHFEKKPTLKYNEKTKVIEASDEEKTLVCITRSAYGDRKWTSEVLNKFQTNKSNTTPTCVTYDEYNELYFNKWWKDEGFSEEPALTYVAEKEEPASSGQYKIKYDVIEARNHDKKWLLVKSVRSDKNREQGIFVKVTKKEFDEYIKEGVHPGFMLVSYQKYIEHVCHLWWKYTFNVEPKLEYNEQDKLVEAVHGKERRICIRRMYDNSVEKWQFNDWNQGITPDLMTREEFMQHISWWKKHFTAKPEIEKRNFSDLKQDIGSNYYLSDHHFTQVHVATKSESDSRVKELVCAVSLQDPDNNKTPYLLPWKGDWSVIPVLITEEEYKNELKRLVVNFTKKNKSRFSGKKNRLVSDSSGVVDVEQVSNSEEILKNYLERNYK